MPRRASGDGRQPSSRSKRSVPVRRASRRSAQIPTCNPKKKHEPFDPKALGTATFCPVRRADFDSEDEEPLVEDIGDMSGDTIGE
jgi:hypothetical protein